MDVCVGRTFFFKTKGGPAKKVWEPLLYTFIMNLVLFKHPNSFCVRKARIILFVAVFDTKIPQFLNYINLFCTLHSPLNKTNTMLCKSNCP